MKPSFKAAVALLFLFSGFCGLLYQILWLRLAYASFGVITPVLSLVLSVFMAGLLAGTWAAGRWVSRLTQATRIPAIYYYALAELVIAAGAYVVPRLFAAGEAALLGSGASDSAGYLWRSALVISASLFPWCMAMGATIPFMLAHLKERHPGGEHGFSFLYTANVVGAMLGVGLSATVMVEALGLKASLDLAALINAGVALGAVVLGLVQPRRPAAGPEAWKDPLPAAGPPVPRSWTLFLTGFSSMGLEVVWTRAFTPVILTQVYSFALILFVYLGATFLGSALYRRHVARGRAVGDFRLMAWLAAGALLPLALTDPRLGLGPAATLLSILPFCMGLGYLTPKLMDSSSQGDPRLAGRAYAANILGSCLGPLAASYLLLPAMGVKGSLLALSLPFLPLAAVLAGPARRAVWAWGAGAAALCLFSLKTFEEPWNAERAGQELRRDHTATVISYGQGRTMRLVVNGMGTTLRSLASWEVPSTAVELVPSVRDAFGYYFEDAKRILAQPGVEVVVDDGRRFLKRGGENYDVITLDPPPPVETAASSLLYSEEFYALAKLRLKPGGVLQQWLPACEGRILQAVTRSLLNSFPHVRMYRSGKGWGHHFIASQEPLPRLGPRDWVSRMPARARLDMMEWEGTSDAGLLAAYVLSQELDPGRVAEGAARGVTDDRPFNEYYFLRRQFPNLAAWLN